MHSRTPHGVRGLKFAHLAIDCMCFSSHPARGTWIEIDRVSTCVSALRSHPARGTWIEMALLRGLKYGGAGDGAGGRRRTPHGVRGLKCADTADKVRRAASHPARGAWIEIFHSPVGLSVFGRRTPHGVRGLKFLAPLDPLHGFGSHPARGAWIEMSSCFFASACSCSVAPRTGCVD